MRALVHQSSSTQRLVAQSNEDGSWLLTKEWRKDKNDPWIQGKGISLPQAAVAQKLGKLLTGDSSNAEWLEELENGVGENGKGDPRTHQS